MPKYNDDILAVENIEGRFYKISLLVPARPAKVEEYVSYLKTITKDFAEQYRCKFVKIEDVYVNPFGEHLVIFFIVKEWKHPEKHRPITKFDAFL